MTDDTTPSPSESCDEEVALDMPTPFTRTTAHPQCPDHLITLAAEHIGDDGEAPPMASMKNVWLGKLEDATLETALQVRALALPQHAQ